MRLKGSRSSAFASLAAGFLLLRGPASASGFLSAGPGARAAAMGGAVTGLADDQSAIFYNPAGLAGQRGTLMFEHIPINESGAGNQASNWISAETTCGLQSGHTNPEVRRSFASS